MLYFNAYGCFLNKDTIGCFDPLNVCQWKKSLIESIDEDEKALSQGLT